MKLRAPTIISYLAGNAVTVPFAERRKIFLNHLMAHAVASRDRALTINGLLSAFQMGVRDAMKEKTTFDDSLSSP